MIFIILIRIIYVVGVYRSIRNGSKRVCGNRQESDKNTSNIFKFPVANALKGESGQKKICFRLLFSEKMLLISFIVLYNKCSNKKVWKEVFL